MPLAPIRNLSAALLFAGGCVAALPLAAQSFAEIDALSDQTADEATGITAAREQAGRGEYLEALATLERVLAVFPKSLEARLIHAIYLCEIDDTQGGLVEIDQLKERDYGSELIAEARDRCTNRQGN